MDLEQKPIVTDSELLNCLANLTDRVLQQEYLNQVEYMEPIVSAISLLDREAQAIRIVELTWEINKIFAARLAGAAHPQVQQQTVGRLKALIKESVVSLYLQIRLLSETSSLWVVTDLINFWKLGGSHHLNIKWDVYYAVENICSHKNPDINIPIVDFLIERLKGLQPDRSPDTLAIKLLGEICDDRALPILLRHLQNPQLWVRNSVAIALGKIGSLQAFDSLLSALQDNHGDKKYFSRCVAKSLGMLGDERAVKPLIEALGDFSYVARWGAGEALAIIGTEEAIDAVIKLLEDETGWVNRTLPCIDEDEIRWVNRISPKTGKWISDDREIGRSERELQNQRSYADKGKLGSLSDEKYERLIEVLFTALSSQDRSLRDRSASVLVGIGDDRAIEPLINALQNGNSDIRAKSAEILGKIGNIRAIEPLIRALQDKHSWVRYHSVFALGRIGDSQASNPLIEVLKKQDYYTFRSTVYALAKINGTQAIEGLNMSLNYAHPNFRKIIAQGLGMTGDERVVDSLKILLQDNSNRVRASAASALGEIDSTLVVAPLISALHDRFWQVRKRAFRSLLKISKYRVNPALSTYFQSRFYNYYNIALEFTLDIDIGIAIAELKNSLQCSKTRIRINSTFWLHKIIQVTEYQGALDSAIELLIAALHDRHSNVRYSAANILGRIPVQYTSERVANLVINALTIVTEDRSDSVRSCAVASIASIRNQTSRSKI